MTSDLADEIRDRAQAAVVAAFDDPAEIVEMLCEVYSDDAEEDELRAVAERVTSEAIRAHLVAQQSWAVPTDNDRLDRAFARLEEHGIVARQNFTCCQTCGHAEIGAELADDSVGYTFFHQQDTESAVEGFGICLAYGARDPDAAVEIGRKVVAALEREGLRPTWNGTLKQRITVPMDWKRRRRA